jgi:hypothetical protein
MITSSGRGGEPAPGSPRGVSGNFANRSPVCASVATVSADNERGDFRDRRLGPNRLNNPYRRVNFMATSDPLFPPTALLPQSDQGGVRVLARNQPGALRPFAATLGVPRPIEAKKHDTTATKNSYRTNSETVNDGNRTTDSVVDTDVDD